jgi:hypothetical protein
LRPFPLLTQIANPLADPFANVVFGRGRHVSSMARELRLAVSHETLKARIGARDAMDGPRHAAELAACISRTLYLERRSPAEA